jgi:hypothetical protein
MSRALGTTIGALVVAIGVSNCGVAATPKKESNAMDDAPTASRPAPPRVLPIDHDGVRYMQDMQSFRHGGNQRGGYLVAVDPKSGERLWMLKVYHVTDHSAANVETPGIYFRTMKLTGPDQLEIENEVGGVYRVDLRARSSTWVSGPQSKP